MHLDCEGWGLSRQHGSHPRSAASTPGQLCQDGCAHGLGISSRCVGKAACIVKWKGAQHCSCAMSLPPWPGPTSITRLVLSKVCTTLGCAKSCPSVNSTRVFTSSVLSGVTEVSTICGHKRAEAGSVASSGMGSWPGSLLCHSLTASRPRIRSQCAHLDSHSDVAPGATEHLQQLRE